MREFFKRVDWKQEMWHFAGAALFVGGIVAAALYRLDH